MKAALFVFLAGFAASCAAAPLVRDLGHGLVYLRIAQLPDDLPSKQIAEAGKPLVLDLRFARTEADPANTFGAWLKSRANPAAPISILTNAETSPFLLLQLATPSLPTGVITQGPASNGFSPDIEVPVTPEADRRAYDALAAGISIADLVTPPLDKPRHDEALLARQYSTGSDEEETQAPAPGAKRVPPTEDLVLARAIHLHRALLALHRVR